MPGPHEPGHRTPFERDQEENDRLELHNRLLEQQGVNTGLAAQGLVPPTRSTAAPEPMVTAFQSRPAGWRAEGWQGNYWADTPSSAAAFYGAGNVYQVQVPQSVWEAGAGAALSAEPNINQRAVELGIARVLPESYFGQASRYDPSAPAQVTQQATERLFAELEGANNAPQARAQQLRQRLESLGAGPAPSGPAPIDVGRAINTGIGGIMAGAGLPGAIGRPGSPDYATLQASGEGANLRPAGYATSTGEISIPGATLRGGLDRLAGAFRTAGQYSNMKPEDFAQNARRLAMNAVNDYTKSLEEASAKLNVGNPQADADARGIAARTGEVIRKLAYNQIGRLESNLGLQGGSSSAAVNVSLSQFRDMVTGAGGFGGGVSQAAAAALGGVQGGMGTVAQSGISFNAGGTQYQVSGIGPGGGSGFIPQGPLGGGGGRGGGGGGRGGIWEGSLGSLMYGGYIARRFWSYTGAPVMRAMEGYGDVQAGLEPLLTGQIPTGGAATMTADRAIGQYSLGQGAYNLVGGAVSLGSQAMQLPGVGTFAAGMGLGGGAALSARILGGAASAVPGLRGIGGFLGGAALPLALGATSLSILGAGADLLSDQTGRRVNMAGTIEEGIRSVARAGFAGGASISNFAANIFGLGEENAGFVGNILNSGYGRWLGQAPGEARAGGEVGSWRDISTLAGELNVRPEDITGLLSGVVNMTGQQGLGGGNRQLVSTMNRLMQTRGLSESGASSLIGGYASALGYLPGEQGYGQAANMFGGLGVLQQSQMMQAAQSRAALGSQFRQIISRDTIGDVALNSMMGAFPTQQVGQVAFGGANRLIAGGMGQPQALALAMSGGQAVAAGRMNENQMQWGLSMAADFGDYLGPSAVRSGQILQAAGGMSMDQMNLYSRISGGDLGALSFAANTGNANPDLALTNIAGQAMWNVNLGQGFQNLGAVANQYLGGAGGLAASQLPGVQSLQAINQLMGGGANLGTAMGQVLGVSNRMQSFFNENPDAGLQDYSLEHSRRMYGFQQAGIGIGMQRIALQRQFMYGGGDWRNPSEGSLWGIEDRMRALQWQGQQASMAFSLESMDTRNQFQVQQEALTSRRMGVTQDYQRWGMGFQRAGMDLSRQFTLENQQYSDQLRAMQTGYTMEDFGENIRMASGRQRRQLVQQRERFVAMNNVQEEQVGRQREQQEELWAREDEAFEKKREYQEQLMELDQNQFEMNVEQREKLYEMNRGDLERQIELAEKLHKLQDEQLEKQREYQIAQLDLSEKALGIQAAAAAAQQQYNEDMRKTSEMVDEVTGFVENAAKYSGAINRLIALTEAIGNVNTSRLTSLINRIEGYSYYGRGPGV